MTEEYRLSEQGQSANSKNGGGGRAAMPFHTGSMAPRSQLFYHCTTAPRYSGNPMPRPRFRRPRFLLLLTFALWLSALARDGVDDWVAATVLPPLTVETSVEVTARDGQLLRAFTVADGRWRMQPGPVDPLVCRDAAGL